MGEGGQRPRWGRWFGSTGAKPLWRQVAYLAAGGGAGTLLGLLVDPPAAAVLAGLTGALVAGAGAAGPSKVAVRLAAFTAVVAVASIFCATALTGRPVWAALAMAAVAVLTSVAAATGPVGAVLGTLGSLAYVLASIVMTTSGLHPDLSLTSGAAHILLGAAGGMMVAAAGARQRDRRDPAAAAGAPLLPSPWHPMWDSVRNFDVHARNGVRRALPLAIGMYFYQKAATRDAMWIFMAAFVVLAPTGKSASSVSIARVSSEIVGVVLLGLLSLVVPEGILLYAAFLLVLLGVAYNPTYPLLAGGLTAMGAILLVGAPTGRIADWAGHRLLDTAIGCALALVSMYVLWPRDRPTDDGPI